MNTTSFEFIMNAYSIIEVGTAGWTSVQDESTVMSKHAYHRSGSCRFLSTFLNVFKNLVKTFEILGNVYS